MQVCEKKPDWQPRHILVDACDAEITAIVPAFAGKVKIAILACSESMEKAAVHKGVTKTYTALHSDFTLPMSPLQDDSNDPD